MSTRLSNPEPTVEAFSNYLTDVRGLRRDEDWDREPSWEFTTKQPDFYIRAARTVLEAKDFVPHPHAPFPSSCAHSPADVIRREIKRVKDTGQFPSSFAERGIACALVLPAGEPPCSMTLDPNDVFEAMLGDLSVTWTPGEFDATARWVYGKDGPMRRPGSGVPQNTRISAVVVVRTRVPSAEAESAADRVIESADVDEKIRPKLGWHAHDVIAESMSNEQMLCVSVHRNPFAKTPFPVEACAGPFDVQYDIVGVRAVREAFVGEALRTAREHGECVARMLLGADHAERRLAEMVLQVAGRAVAPKGDLSDQRPG